MAFDGNQISHAEDDIRWRGAQFGVETIGIGCVINHCGREWSINIFCYLVAHSFADANNRTRRAIDLLRNALTPFAGISADLIRKECVESVN